MNSIAQAALRIAIPLVIIGAGVGMKNFLVSQKSAPTAKPPSDVGVSVRTVRVKATKQLVSVAAQGTVVPAREVSIQPEVQGRVVFASEALVPGGRFKKGQVLLRIDSSEYSLRAKQSASQVQQAEQQLKLEESRGAIAAKEWQLIGEDQSASDSGRSVALRKPQRKEAELQIELAQNTRDLAVLNVGRTTLRAPFDGIVRSGQVNVGQFISPQLSLGSLVASDSYWAQVSIPVERLGAIQVPGFNVAAGEGSKVSVWQEVGEERIQREGHVVRLYGDVDPMGRLARVLVEIDDPIGLKLEENERGLPLLLGAYVQVDISGGEMMEVIEIPRAAVHSGRYVYVMTPEERLEIRDVKIAWRKPKSFLLSGGLKDGDEVVTSRLGTAVEGLKLRRVAEGAAGASIGAKADEVKK